jgi:hypothetical protein
MRRRRRNLDAARQDPEGEFEACREDWQRRSAMYGMFAATRGRTLTPPPFPDATPAAYLADCERRATEEPRLHVKAVTLTDAGRLTLQTCGEVNREGVAS